VIVITHFGLQQREFYPTHWEAHCGAGAAKKWKASIKVGGWVGEQHLDTCCQVTHSHCRGVKLPTLVAMSLLPLLLLSRRLSQGLCQSCLPWLAR
jgi:hypothetical protein